MDPRAKPEDDTCGARPRTVIPAPLPRATDVPLARFSPSSAGRRAGPVELDAWPGTVGAARAARTDETSPPFELSRLGTIFRAATVMERGRSYFGSDPSRKYGRRVFQVIRPSVSPIRNLAK